MALTKEMLEARKKELEDQLNDLVIKNNQMVQMMVRLQGAIAEIQDWLKEE